MDLDDVANICEVVDRVMEYLEVERLIEEEHVAHTRMDLHLSLGTAHQKNPLRLAEMKTGRMVDVIHDVLGIHQNLNRTTGGFRECFTPRFAVVS